MLATARKSGELTKKNFDETNLKDILLDLENLETYFLKESAKRR